MRLKLLSQADTLNWETHFFFFFMSFIELSRIKSRTVTDALLLLLLCLFVCCFFFFPQPFFYSVNYITEHKEATSRLSRLSLRQENWGTFFFFRNTHFAHHAQSVQRVVLFDFDSRGCFDLWDPCKERWRASKDNNIKCYIKKERRKKKRKVQLFAVGPWN